MAAHDIGCRASRGRQRRRNRRDFVERRPPPTPPFVGDGKLSHTLDETIAMRRKFLTDYQDAAYAKQYTDFVAKVRASEAAKRTPGIHRLVRSGRPLRRSS